MSLVLLSGCQGDPPLYPLTGKVTLGGKSYERLIVYFRPIGKKVNEFNLGVGETDAAGILKLRSTAGDGLAAGKYRVSFTCLQREDSKAAVGMSDEKADDNPKVKIIELVPPEYCDNESSPVEFEISSSGNNNFEFDIPAK